MVCCSSVLVNRCLNASWDPNFRASIDGLVMNLIELAVMMIYGGGDTLSVSHILKGPNFSK